MQGSQSPEGGTAIPSPDHWGSRTGRAIRATFPTFASAVPVALVNATAFIGQFAYLRQHVHWVVPGQVLIAVTLESVAVYKPVALPLQIFQASMLWMKAFDEDYGLIRRYHLLRASQYGCFMPFDVNLQKVDF